MTKQDFENLSKETIKECFKLLTEKGFDYRSGSEDDALVNFKNVASKLGLTPVQVWSCYFYKHVEAILTFVKKNELKSENIESRIQDAINYLLLFNGLIKEQETKDAK